jgi:hypothetical protein
MGLNGFMWRARIAQSMIQIAPATPARMSRTLEAMSRIV